MKRLSPLFARLNPAVPRHWLVGLAGMLWTGVSLLLYVRAVNWLSDASLGTTLAVAIGAVGIALPGYKFGFSGVVRKNIVRIGTLPDRACVFALTPWKGYAMIVLMITLGVTLRNSPIPKHLLSLPYTAMGTLLLMGSVGFYQHFIRLRSGKALPPPAAPPPPRAD